MSIELYDSLGQKNKVLNTSQTTYIYLCGPTVYDNIHIGNLRPVIIFDILIRYLKEKKYKYFYIHNITDIDDKIIAKAQKENCTEEEISKRYTEKYLNILKEVNVIFPDAMPKVSENIPEIQEIISKLLEKEYAYKDNGDILFKTEKIKNYTELSKQNIEDLSSENKQDINFVLWKKTEIGKNWDSPWGKGRPGWHTECFAFIEKYCKGKISIHGGGVDLKFPHHENENAQSWALNNRGLSDIWIHIGHVSNKYKKISKSDHKLFLVKELLQKYNPNILRYIFLKQNYTNPLELDEEKIINIKKEFNGFLNAINHTKSLFFLNNKNLNNIHHKQQIDSEFLNYLEKNLNLPNLDSLLHKYLKNLLISIKNKSIHDNPENYHKLVFHLTWLGFQIPDIHTQENKKLLLEWENYKKNNDYKNGDKLRNVLQEKNLII